MQVNGNSPTCADFCWRTAWACLLIIFFLYAASMAYRVIVRYDGNITGLFCVGDTEPVPIQLQDKGFYIHRGWIGYDGQFSLYLAYDPLLKTDMLRSFDGPAYRCQRIGLPMLAHLVALGNDRAIPYALVGINFVAFLVGCWFFLQILDHFKASPFWVFAYAFSPGLMASEFRGLFDATSTSLVFIAIWAMLKERWAIAAVLLCVGTLVRETTVLMSGAVALCALRRGEVKKAVWFALPAVVYAAWATYVHLRVGAWQVASGFTTNFDWPMVGIVEKFTVILAKIIELNPGWPWVIPVEVIFNLGLIFAIYLAVKRLDQAPHDWLTLGLCAYASLAIVLSSFPWSRFWHTARVLEPLLLFPLLIYLQTKDRKYLVPLACAVPVSMVVFFSTR